MPILSKNPGVDKGPQPLMFNPALTTCASERMKTQRFSFFAGFAARERMREAKPVKLKKVAFSHFFDTLSTLKIQSAVIFMHLDELDYGHLGSVATTGTHLEDAGVAAVASLVLGGDLVE